MAKIKVEKTEARQNSGQLFVLKHNNKRVLVARPKTYEVSDTWLQDANDAR